MSESVSFCGSIRKYSFEKFALEDIPAKPGVLCLAVFFEGRWLALQFEQHYDLSNVDMTALIQTCSQKHSELHASDFFVFLDIHDSNDSGRRKVEVYELRKAHGMDPLARSKIPLLASENLEKARILDGPVYFYSTRRKYLFHKFKLEDIPAKPGVFCLAIFHETRWLALLFEHYYDLSKVDMHAMIQTYSQKHSEVDASDVFVFLDVHEIDESFDRIAEVRILREATGLDPDSKTRIPLLASGNLENDKISDVPVTFQGMTTKFRFKRFPQRNIPAKPGVLCLAVYYYSRWMPLKFDQSHDLSTLDLSALIQSCRRENPDLDEFEVVTFLNVHKVDDSNRRESEVISHSEAYSMHLFSDRAVPMQMAG